VTEEEKGRGSLAEKRMAMVVTGGGMMHSLLDCGSFPTPSPQYHVSLVAVSSSLPAYSSSSRFGGGSKPLLLRCQAPGAYKLDCSTPLNPILVSASSTQSSRYEGDSREEGLKNSTMASTPFHLAIPVHDIEAAREFFGGYVIFFPLNMHAVEPPPACHPRIFPVNVMPCICVTQKSFTAQ
jgi:hypothetical protein